MRPETGSMVALAVIVRNWATLLSLGVLCLVCLPAQATPKTIQIDENSRRTVLEAGSLSLSETIPLDAEPLTVISGGYANTFIPTNRAVTNALGNDKAIWGHARLENMQSKPTDIAFVLKYTAFDFIDFYTLSPSGDLKTAQHGQIPVLDRSLSPSRFPMMPISLEPNETRDVYFRIRTDTLAIMPAQVYDLTYYQFVETRDVLIFSLLIGVMLAMAALGLITFFSARQYAYLWFSSFTLAGALYTLIGSNIGKTYLWPDRSVDDVFLIFVVLGVAMASAALFVARFLETAKHAPKLHLALQIIAGCSLVTCLTTPLPYWVIVPAFLVSAGIGPIFILAALITLWFKKVRGAGLVAMSWIPNQLGITWVFLRGIDVVPYSEFNHFALPLSCTVTAIAFTWALHRRNREAEHNATHDLLTGLPNRLRLEQVIAEPPPLVRRAIGVMQIDLDGFKTINDTHGHAAGDHVLAIVAERLRELCSPYGIAFRTGGDEFVILCHRRTRQSDTEQLAEKIVTVLAQPIPWRGQLLKVGASIGLAFPLEGRETINVAFEHADEALYQAKRTGKGRVVTCEDVLVPGNDNALDQTG